MARDLSLPEDSRTHASLHCREVQKLDLVARGKQNLKGGQFIAPNLFGEAQARVAKAISRIKGLAPQELEPEVLRSTTICGSCGAEVSLNHNFCVVCGGPLTATAVSAPVPATYRVMVEHAGLSRQQALAHIIQQENEGLEEVAVRTACEQFNVVVASGLTLERANEAS